MTPDDSAGEVSIHDIAVETITGEQQRLSDFRGRTLLVVNVASACGYTPQYEGLERLYRAHRDNGLEVLGFPCNQFGGQEPGTNHEIASFCSLTYDVTFPMFARIDVNGEHAHPLYRALKQAKPGLLGTEAIKWNFTKFLVGPDGTVLARYGPGDKPEAIEPEIVAQLATSRP